MEVITTWTNANPNTIWGRLATKLGREPTHAEATAEVKRILSDNVVNIAGRGQLRFQR